MCQKRYPGCTIGEYLFVTGAGVLLRYARCHEKDKCRSLNFRLSVPAQFVKNP